MHTDLVVKQHQAYNLLFKLRDREREKKDKESVVKCKNLRVLGEGTLKFFVLHLQLFYKVCNYERLKKEKERKNRKCRVRSLERIQRVLACPSARRECVPLLTGYQGGLSAVPVCPGLSWFQH